MFLLLKNTKDNERDPTNMDGVLTCSPTGTVIVFGSSTVRTRARWACSFQDHLANLLLDQIPTHYPTVDVEILPPQTLDPAAGDTVWSVDVTLRPDLYPIQPFSQYQETDSRQVADPVDAILAAVSTEQDPALRSSIEIVIVPTHWYRQWRSRRAVHRLACPDFRYALERSRWYAHGITDRRWYVRLAFWLYGLKRHTVPQRMTSQEVTAASSRQHNHEVGGVEREDFRRKGSMPRQPPHGVTTCNRHLPVARSSFS